MAFTRPAFNCPPEHGAGDRLSFSPWPYFSDEEIAAAVEVLRSGKVNYWTGDECKRFEQEYAAHVGAKYAIAAANGTLTLELALLARGIGPGDEVVVTPRSYVASVSCVINCGATPIFADVDQDSGNITASSISQVISDRTRAVIPVHLAGWPCDMDPIMELASQHGLFVLEDCAQAHGAVYRKRPVGSLGHVGSFSFCQDKILTTGGEGGMVLTDDEDLWKKMWSLKEHGKSYDACFKREWPPGFKWLHESFGSNCRMTEMQAAIGRVILKKLPHWVHTRKANALQLREALSKFPSVRAPEAPADLENAYYKYYCYVNPTKLKHGWSRDRLMTSIAKQGIPCFSGSCSEIYLEAAFVNSNLQPSNRLPVAKELGETSLMFLVHPTLRTDEIARVCAVIEAVFHEATA